MNYELLIDLLTTNLIANKKYEKDVSFRKYRRQLFHSSLAKILELLKPGMTTPEVVRCPDGHFRRAIYGLGPYIADYPEQALLACIVQGWCAK
jgi:Plavaka transposase